MADILVITQAPGGAAGLCAGLERHGFHPIQAAARELSVPQMRRLSRSVVLCEWRCTKDSQLRPSLRAQHIPVLWLTEPADLPLSLRSFRLGLEDYIVLPVNTADLLARVHMLMHCAGLAVGRSLTIGPLFLDGETRTASVDGREIPLTVREFDLLFGLLSAPENAFTRRELMQRYWGKDSTTNPRAVDVYMTKLREKFACCSAFRIVTVHGVGYKAVLTPH